MGLPKGSCVVCTPTVYLTDKSWQEAVPHICAGINENENGEGSPRMFGMLDVGWI